MKSARALPFKIREDCEREDWLEELEQADGIFMTGGNQLRLSTNPHLLSDKERH